ncbi:MAG: hypothetical protein AAGA60_09425 [Cyanobacteria bacterium P01_E01_bin.42]
MKSISAAKESATTRSSGFSTIGTKPRRQHERIFPLAEWRDRLARLQALPNPTAFQLGKMESLKEAIEQVEGR